MNRTEMSMINAVIKKLKDIQEESKEDIPDVKFIEHGSLKITQYE